MQAMVSLSPPMDIALRIASSKLSDSRKAVGSSSVLFLP
jgi:hypothetical protein